MAEDDPVLDALLWAWTNATGRLPDRNTMSEDDVAVYYEAYRDRLRQAVFQITGQQPDEHLQSSR